MAKTLSVDERSIMEFLSSGEKNDFLIPDYQRKYDWDPDNINLLFDDLAEFTEIQNARSSDDKYFLGTIVSYVNDNGDREIIDGQQRIVSLLILLRAIYTKLSMQSNQSEDIEEQLKEIRTTIWRRIDIRSSKVDYEKNYIRSESIDDNYKESLQTILTTGRAKSMGKDDKYAKNYLLMQKRYNEFYAKDKSMAEWFVYYMLKRTIVFSIEAGTRDAALTIFSTINNRGKSLSDTDIIRAKIYSSLNGDEKKCFNVEWSALVKKLGNIGETMENILSYYMYYVRALDGDYNQTMKGLKNYFSQERSRWLKDKNILQTFDRIVEFWGVVNKQETIDGEPWSQNIEILQLFDVMRTFQNYSWRSAAVIYYLAHASKPDFQQNYLRFLKKLFSQYVPLYILNTDRTFLRARILKLDVDAINSIYPRFEFQINPANDLSLRDNINRLKQSIILSSNAIIRKVLLKMIAYNCSEQYDLLPGNAEVEHIMPQKWQMTYSSRGYDKDKFDEYVEQLGNLTLLESSFNRKVSNSPFELKKETYLESSIAMTRDLIYEPDEWTPDAIAVRSDKLADSLIKLWQKWSDDYDR